MSIERIVDNDVPTRIVDGIVSTNEVEQIRTANVDTVTVGIEWMESVERRLEKLEYAPIDPKTEIQCCGIRLDPWGREQPCNNDGRFEHDGRFYCAVCEKQWLKAHTTTPPVAHTTPVKHWWSNLLPKHL